MRKHWPAVLMISAAMAIPARAKAQEQAGTAKAAATVEAAVGTAVADRALSGAARSFLHGGIELLNLRQQRKRTVRFHRLLGLPYRLCERPFAH